MGVETSAYFGLYLSVTDDAVKTFTGTNIAVVPEIGLTAEIEDDVYGNMLPSTEKQYFGVTIHSLDARCDERVFDDVAADMASAQTKLMSLLITIYSKDDAQTLAESAKFMHVMCYY